MKSIQHGLLWIAGSSFLRVSRPAELVLQCAVGHLLFLLLLTSSTPLLFLHLLVSRFYVSCFLSYVLSSAMAFSGFRVLVIVENVWFLIIYLIELQFLSTEFLQLNFYRRRVSLQQPLQNAGCPTSLWTCLQSSWTFCLLLHSEFPVIWHTEFSLHKQLSWWAVGNF